MLEVSTNAETYYIVSLCWQTRYLFTLWKSVNYNVNLFFL